MQQSPSKAHNFLELLFKPKRQEQQPPHTLEQKVYRLQKSTHKLKEKNAKRVLVIGDFTASSVADALKKFFNNNTIIINNTIPDSGLIRTDYYSWENNIAELINNNRPKAIIIMIGANDNQPITTNQDILSTDQPIWMNTYKQKIFKITEILHNSRIPWIWVGQPPFKNNNLTQKMRTFNKLYKNATEAAEGSFIDIWDGFIDAQGQFSFLGYNTNGKTVRLRTNDGVNFTFEGKKKLASYLEQKLKTILNFHSSFYESIDLNNSTAQFKQELNHIERQPPMSLYDRAQQNTRLLGIIDPHSIKKSWLPPNGHQIDRADNFSFHTVCKNRELNLN